MPHITERLRQLKLKVVDGFRVRFKPSEADLVGAYEYGYQFGCRLLDKPLAPPEKNGRPQAGQMPCVRRNFRRLAGCVPGVRRGPRKLCSCGGRRHRLPARQPGILSDPGRRRGGAERGPGHPRADATGSIVMVSEEPYAPTIGPCSPRPAGRAHPRTAGHGEPEWYQENRIYQVLGKRAQQVDLAKREVTLSGGEVLQFTKLIYALGSECFVPPMPGSELEGVVAVRRLADVRRVEALMKQTKHAVVIGGGVAGPGGRLGTEKGRPCRYRAGGGSPADAPPAGRNCRRPAHRRRRKGGHCGAHRRSGEAIQGSGRAEAVVLENGERFQAGLVIVSAGVRANTALAGAMGLQTGRAVLVNERMETSAPACTPAATAPNTRAQTLPTGRRLWTRARWPVPTPRARRSPTPPPLMGLTFRA